jgi:hypothetical protein
MADEFAQRAAAVAVSNVEEELIQAQRNFEDAARSGDAMLAGDSLVRYDELKTRYDRLTGANQPQQQSGRLSVAQQNFLSRRRAGGDELTPRRMQDYSRAHEKAVAAGFQPDSPGYFSSIEGYVDHLGDGRQPPLSEREAARLCGVSEEVYAANAAKLRHMKATGEYNS